MENNKVGRPRLPQPPVEIITLTRDQYRRDLQEAAERAIDGYVKKHAELKNLDLCASVAIQDLAKEHKIGKQTLLERVKERCIPTVKMHPVTIEARYIPMVLKQTA